MKKDNSTKSKNRAKRVLSDGYLTANELRIGNVYEYLILDKSDPRKEWWEVSVCDASDLVYLETNPKDVGFKPILLNEEWLLKFGFYHREFSFDKGSFYLIKRTCKKEYLYQAHTKRFQVKYVHQLQNLYFAVTAVELTFE